MKKSPILFLMVVSCLFGCDEKEIVDASALLGTWRVVEEKRITDNWTQSDNSGITTDWEISNPLGGAFSVTSVQFHDDQVFYWNVDQIDDLPQFIAFLKSPPVDRTPTYTFDGNANEISLYTPFEYVGIVKVNTTKFRILQINSNSMVLRNGEVQLKFIRTDP